MIKKFVKKKLSFMSCLDKKKKLQEEITTL